MNNAVKGHIYGVIARFGGPNELLAAAGKLREAGYRQFDCHSPFPIHGMNEAMGIPRSRLGFIAGAGALIGGAGALTLQGWSAAKAYPIVISGKPFFSYQAFVPITFAVTVLCAAFATVIGFLALTRWSYHHPLFNSDKFGRFSDDGFFISVDGSDPKFDAAGTADFLKSIGGEELEMVNER